MKSAGKPVLTYAPLQEKEDLHLIVRIDGKVVATALLHPVNTQIAQIKQVAVSEKCQGLGIGRKLLDYAEKVAQNLGFTLVFLTGRKQAWHFYEKLGYDSLAETYFDHAVELKVFKKKLAVTKSKEMKTNGRQ
ncbi:GNAT family N-acetyltransferase [Enterococcus sp. AZ109]|uniref:GNAT family N-acetyltransferase n=1 Tax=Enterococcus sp. AZ109 TaxID=2774634 RepID=UPI003F222E6D